MHPNQPLESVIFNIFDTETTGNNIHGDDKPIELAIVQFNLEKGFLSKPFSTLINPEKNIHPSAIMIHGLVDEDVENSPKLEEILTQAHSFIGDHPLVGHNIDFDLQMIPSFNKTSNLKIDTLRLAKQLFKIGDIGYKGHDLRSYKSEELRYWLNLKVDTLGLPAHRAAADILVTGTVLSSLLKKYLELGNTNNLGSLISFINAPILIQNMPFGKFKGESISEVVSKEIQKTNNYFTWLYQQIDKGDMTIEPDVLYSIDYHLKQNGIDPAFLLNKTRRPFYGK